MKPPKEIARDIFHRLGLEISRYRPDYPTTRDGDRSNHLEDIRRFISGSPCMVFDVGANLGQSVRDFRRAFPECQIHSFEPGPETFELLFRNVGSCPDVFLNNLAVGSQTGRKTLLENTQSDMSSFLRPGELAWGAVAKETPVSVVTLDQYCDEKGISHINLLKTDTQGFDFEVLKGAQRLISNKRIQLIYMEVTFSNMYEGLPPFDEVYGFLRRSGFQLVSFYQFHYQREMVSWTDSLFLNPAFEPARPEAETPPTPT